MDETQQLEILDLGDAKDWTRGPGASPIIENNPVHPYRPAD